MNTTERAQSKVTLQGVIDDWIVVQQESNTPFDCYIGEETSSLMADAAFAVIEAVEDGHQYLKSQGMLSKESES